MRSFDERGTFTIWALGLCITLFMFGGITVDLWRAFDARRELNYVADSAARAGASQIDIRQRQLYGTIILDDSLVQSEVARNISENAGLQSISIDDSIVNIDHNTNEVSVEIHSKFSFFLLRIFPSGNDAPIISKASARPFEG